MSVWAGFSPLSPLYIDLHLLTDFVCTHVYVEALGVAPQVPPTLVLEAESLSILQLTEQVRLAGRTSSPGKMLVSTSPVLASSAHTTSCPAFLRMF